MTTMLVSAARAARLVLALAAIAWVAGCAGGLPPGAAGTRTQAGSAPYADPDDPLFGKYHIALSRNGAEIAFVGPIGSASASALQKALDENPQIRVVRLSSPGGSAVLAMALERAIRAKGLITYVPSLCASACTFIFLGGRERYVAPLAQLGFHRGIGLDDSPAEATELADAMKTWMLSRGVAADFVARTMSTPSTSMWFPTLKELLQAGVITAATANETFASPSAAERSPSLVNGASLNTPYYLALKRFSMAIKKADPATYQLMQDDLHQAVRSGAYEPEKSQLASAHLDSALRRAVAIADDDAVVEFARGLMEQLEFLSKTDPRRCAAAAAGKADQHEPGASSIPPYLIERQVAAMTAILETSVSKPQPPPSAERVHRILATVVSDVAREFGGQTQHLGRPDLDPQQSCAIRHAILKRALSLDTGDRSVLLRGMLSDMI